MKGLIVLLLIPICLNLEFKIEDEDYLVIPFGGKKRAMKLLIDPMGHFTYILRPVISSTMEKFKENYNFSNNFGEFEGHWEEDFMFPTKEREFGFKLRYLRVDKKDTNLDVDGVIGLGYSDHFPDNTNIYKILSKMKSIFNFKNVMTYDKAHSKLVLGEVPDFDSFNPVDFDIIPNKVQPVNLVNLTKIGFFDKSTNKVKYIDINQKAKFGLMPLLVAPKIAKNIMDEIIANIAQDNSTAKYENNAKKLYQDIYFDKSNENIKPEGIFGFGDIAYKFKHTWNAEGEKPSSSIRFALDDYGDYWYIGVDKLNINRADFDFDNKKVTMYSTSAYEIGKTKYPYIAVSLLITITFASIIAIAIRYCCHKKKQNEIKEGEELAYL